MFYQNLLFSCWSCIKGHRSNSCNHQDRPLWLLKNKGRPGLAKNSQRDPNKPDLPYLHCPEFITLHSSICRDSSNRKDYYHSEDPSLSPKKPIPPRTATTPPRAEAQRDLDLMYRAPLSDDTFARWVQCCKIGGTQMGANVFNTPTSGLIPHSRFSFGSSSPSPSPFSLEPAHSSTVFPTTTTTTEFPSEPLISEEQLDNICNLSPSDFDNLFPLLDFSFNTPTSGLLPPSSFSSGSSSPSPFPPEPAHPTASPFSLDPVLPPTTTATTEFPSDQPLISDQQLDNICDLSSSDLDNLFPLLDFSFEDPSPLLFEPVTYTLPLESTSTY